MIRVENLSTGYTRDKILLDKYSYTFDDNRIYSIMGKSGIGKTTLLKTISGLIKPMNGLVYVDGEVIHGAARGVYMMNQSYTSFNWLSCIDNITIIDKIKRNGIDKSCIDKAKDLLNTVGLAGYENIYPSKLSGGQRQRLAFARAMYARPKHLLMDEPLSALDGITREKMQTILCDFQSKYKSTILVVTHSKDEADRIGGKIIWIE